MTVTLNWQAQPSALFYRIYRGTSSGGPYQLMGQSNPNPGQIPTPNNSQVTTTFVDGTCVNGQDYYYVISTVTLDGESPYSAEIPALYPGQPPAPVVSAAIVT